MISRRDVFGLMSVAALQGLSEASAAESCLEEAGDIVTSAKVARFAPGAPAKLTAELVSRWSLANQVQLITPMRIQHFFTQIATETGGFAALEENLNYSEKGLRKTFRKRVTQEDARRLAGLKPAAKRKYEIAEHVYGGRFGNKSPGDGWKYRGSGYIQLTFKDNFAARGRIGDVVLVDFPDEVRLPKVGFQAALAYWNSVKANEPADLDKIEEVRRRVNGGDNGLPEARVWLARAKRTLKPGSISPDEGGTPDLQEMAAVNALLQGTPETDTPDESFSPQELVERLRAFREQEDMDQIDVTGVPAAIAATLLYDDILLYKLMDPRNWRVYQD